MSSFIVILCKNSNYFRFFCHWLKIQNYFYLHLIWNLMCERHVATFHIIIVVGQPEF